MANKSCIGLIRKFTKTGDIGGKKLLVVLNDDVCDDNTIEKDTDRFLIAEVEYIKRNKQGELISLVFVDDDPDYPIDMTDTSVDEFEVFEIVDDKVESSLPTYKDLALWLNEEMGRAVLTNDGMVTMALAYNINNSNDPVDRIEKYTNDLSNDDAWKDINDFIRNEMSEGNEYWKIVK